MRVLVLGRFRDHFAVEVFHIGQLVRWHELATPSGTAYLGILRRFWLDQDQYTLGVQPLEGDPKRLAGLYTDDYDLYRGHALALVSPWETLAAVDAPNLAAFLLHVEV